MTGELKSPKVLDKVDSFIADLDKYSASRALTPPAPIPSQVQGWFLLGFDELAELPKEELGRMGVVVMSYSYHIQNEINIMAAKIVRCRTKIGKIIEPILDDYGRFKTEDNRIAAIYDNEAALAYYEIQQNCEAFIKRWEWMVQRCDAFVKAIESYIYARRT